MQHNKKQAGQTAYSEKYTEATGISQDIFIMNFLIKGKSLH